MALYTRMILAYVTSTIFLSGVYFCCTLLMGSDRPLRFPPPAILNATFTVLCNSYRRDELLFRSICHYSRATSIVEYLSMLSSVFSRSSACDLFFPLLPLQVSMSIVYTTHTHTLSLSFLLIQALPEVSSRLGGHREGTAARTPGASHQTMLAAARCPQTPAKEFVRRHSIFAGVSNGNVEAL
jgi:hypothetical protein